MKQIQTNSMDVEQLLVLMEHNHFLYPAKKERLSPILPDIKRNLRKAFALPASLYRTLTFHDEPSGVFASIAAWRYSPSSAIIQHLVSNHPVKTREIFLCHIRRLAAADEQVQAILTYYQPKTRFAHRMFTHLHERRIDGGLIIEPFHFYAWQQEKGNPEPIGKSTEDDSVSAKPAAGSPPANTGLQTRVTGSAVFSQNNRQPAEANEENSFNCQAQASPSHPDDSTKAGAEDVRRMARTGAAMPDETVAGGWMAVEVGGQNQAAFLRLLLRERGWLYAQALDLGEKHLNLAELDTEYQRQGLHRNRRVLLCSRRDGSQVGGALVINRGSVGLHFSQIENAAEFIADSELPPDGVREIFNCLAAAASNYYQDWPLASVPLLVLSSQAGYVTAPGLVFQRQYNLMICNRANFHNWLAYLEAEYEKSLNYPSPGGHPAPDPENGMNVQADAASTATGTIPVKGAFSTGAFPMA